MLKSIIKMVTYLPEMHEFFKYFPTKHVMRENNATLTNRVKLIEYAPEEVEEEIKMEMNESNSGATKGNAVPLGTVSEQEISATLGNDPRQENSKLFEVQKLLPAFMLCLDMKVAGKAMKSFQKMMIYGDLSFRISLVDQMIYFLKELMLDSPEDFLVPQYLHLLTSMIKIWH